MGLEINEVETILFVYIVEEKKNSRQSFMVLLGRLVDLEALGIESARILSLVKLV